MALPYTYRDLNFLFAANPISGDISAITDSDAIKQSVVNLVTTKHYERPFHPEIGCNVTDLLFENATFLTANSIQRSIADVITNFEPRVTLKTVNVDLEPDQNAFSVTITFYIKNITNLVTISFFLERTR